MKFLSAVFLTILLSYAGSLFFPWWIIAVAAFIVGLAISLKPAFTMLAASTALYLFWGGYALLIDYQNNHVLATRMASLLPLGGSAFYIIQATAFIGALVAGMAALTGCYLRRAVFPAKHK